MLDGNKESGDHKTVIPQGRVTGPTRRSLKGGWTAELDKFLTLAVQQFKGKNWKKIAELVPGRNDIQCLHRWQKVLNPDLYKGTWSKEEDNCIIELVKKRGKNKWAEIAKSLPGRIGKQCRERWHNHLNPEIKNTPWTKEEEETLIEAHKKIGNKWAEIALSLPGRTENSIKNHWNCSLKKKLDLYSARGTPSSNQGFSTLDSKNHKSEAGNRKFQFSIGQRGVPERYLGTCSPNLVLENAEGGNCGFPREVSKNGSVKLRFGSSNTPRGLCVSPTWDYEHTNKPPSNPINISTACPNSPLNVTAQSGNGIPPSKIALSVDSKRFGKLGKGNEKGNDPKRTLNFSGEKIGSLCYVPLQENDLKIFMVTGKFPTTDSYIRIPSTPDFAQTPTTHERTISNDYISPESILKSAAMSYKNVPSIIRKQGLRSSRQAKNGSQSTSPHVDDDLSTEVPMNEKQFFLSPPKSRRLENSPATKSVEKRLEFAFDEVSDSETAN